MAVFPKHLTDLVHYGDAHDVLFGLVWWPDLGILLVLHSEVTLDGAQETKWYARDQAQVGCIKACMIPIVILLWSHSL